MTEELVERAERAYLEFFRTLAAASRSFAVEEDDGLVLISGGTGLPMLSLATARGLIAEAKSLVEQARRFYRGRAERFMLSARGEEAVRIGAVLAADGISGERSVRMLMSPIDRHLRWPDGLYTRRVRDRSAFLVYNDAMTAAFGGEPWARTDALDVQELLAVPGSAHYVGYVTGEPVATAARLDAFGVSVIANVGVVPSARRRGIGEAMTGRALVEATRTGCTAAYLQASVMGYPVYKRKGFREIRPWTSWLLEP
jgi:ribosomal protein S18 acetylase RimI-like enzyme